MMRLQTKLKTSYYESLKTELQRIKSKLSKIADVKTQGTIIRSRARWYEHGERNSKYFYNLEKSNQNDGDKITNPKDILEEEERYFQEIYLSRNIDPNCLIFNDFFETEYALSEEIAKTCEGVMSIEVCERALNTMENNKFP